MACAMAMSPLWLIETLISPNPSASNTALACPVRLTMGAPEGEGRTSIPWSGASAPFHSGRVSGDALEMACCAGWVEGGGRVR